MALEISSIQNAELQEIAKGADKNNDGKLKRDEYSLFAKEAQAKGVDYKEINEALGMNGFQRWWHDVDKISTDGNDDGKLSFKEGATSFAKGLLGGIPKAMVKHPIASVLTLGAFAGLTALTGGAILPVLTAVGIATGIGMAGVGTYKAITAKKDGDAKQALENMGMGVTTTAMSMLSAGKALKTAEKAGVKSAHVEENANIFQKSFQTFKSIPESLKQSGQKIYYSLPNKEVYHNIIIDEVTPTEVTKVKTQELEVVLNEKGIKTKSLGYQIVNEYHGAHHHEYIGYGNSGMEVYYKGRIYFIKPIRKNEIMLPVEFKEHFVNFLNGEVPYTDFYVTDVTEGIYYSSLRTEYIDKGLLSPNYNKCGPYGIQTYNPFEAVTDSRK